jgi:hypothetical protein
MADKISPSLSMKGYNIKKALIGTKDQFKALISALLAIGAYFATQPFVNNQALSGMVSAITMAFSAWILNTIDFYFTTVKLE